MLCGCDYLPTIKGVGPKTAHKLVKECGSMEAVLEKLRAQKAKGEKKNLEIPDGFDFERARALFVEPAVEVADKAPDFKFKDPDEAGLLKFLVEEKGFGEERTLNHIKRLKKARGKSSQRRMDSFFKKFGNVWSDDLSLMTCIVSKEL